MAEQDDQIVERFQSFIDSADDETKTAVKAKFDSLKNDPNLQLELITRISGIGQKEQSSQTPVNDGGNKVINTAKQVGVVGLDIGEAVFKGLSKGSSMLAGTTADIVGVGDALGGTNVAKPFRALEEMANEASKGTGRELFPSGPFTPKIGPIPSINVPESFFEMVGMAPGVAATIAVSGGLVAKSAKSLLATPKLRALAADIGDFKFVGGMKVGTVLTESSALSVIEGLKEYRASGGDIFSTTEAAGIGFTLGLSGPFIASSLSAVRALGKGAGEAWVAAATGSKDIAKNFIDRMHLYNTNSFNPVKNLKQFESDAFSRTKSMKSDHVRELQVRENLANSISSKNHNEIENHFNLLVDAETKAFNERAVSKTAEKLKKNIENSANSIENTKKIMSQKLLDDYENTLSAAQIKHNQVGALVDEAVETAIQRSPSIAIDAKAYVARFKSVLEKNGLTTSVVEKEVVKNIAGQKVTEVIEIPVIIQIAGSKAEGKALTTRLSNIYQDMKNVITENGNMTLAQAQAFKRNFQQAGFNASEGAKMRPVFEQLTGGMSPANFEPKLYAEASKGNINKFLKEIKKANEKSAEVIAANKNIQKYYTKLDADGKAIPDYDRVLSLVKGSKDGKNIATLNNIRKSESILPVNERLLPKVENHVEIQNKINAKHKKLLDGYELDLLNKSKELKQKITDLERKRKFELKTNKESDALKTKIALDDIKIEQQESIDDLKYRIQRQRELIKEESALKRAVSGTFAGRAIQLTTALGATAGMAGANVGVGAGVGGILSAGASPTIAANTVKTADVTIGNILRTLSSFAENRFVRQTTIAKAANQQNQ